MSAAPLGGGQASGGRMEVRAMFVSAMEMRRLMLGIAAGAVVGAACAVGALGGDTGGAGGRGDAGGAFEAYRAVGNEAFEVRVDGVWYRLSAVNGMLTEKLLASAVWAHGEDWFGVFAADLPGLLERRLGEPVSGTIAVVLEPSGGGAPVERELELTEEKEASADASAGEVARALRGAPSWSLRAIDREHAAGVPDYLQAAVQRIPFPPSGDAVMLTGEQAARDLDELEWLIEHCWSYRTYRGVEYRDWLDAMRAAAAEGIDARDFRLQVAHLLAQFGDGHAGVQGLRESMVPGYMPFTIREGRRRVLGLGEDGKPYHETLQAVKAIDGLTIEQWVAVGAQLVPDATTFFERPVAVDMLNSVQHMRAAMGAPLRDEVEVTFWGYDKTGLEVRTLPVVSTPPPRPAPAPAFDRATLAGGVGYLKLGAMAFASREEVAAMSAGGAQATAQVIAVEDIHDAMAAFRGAPGLVIDVRGNRGGSREVLNILLPYFLPPADGPRMVTAAKYKLRPGDDANNPVGFLADQLMHPVHWAGWDEAERRVLASFGEEFDPIAGSRPPEEGFSAMHVMVVSPGSGEPYYHFGAQVYVLTDWYCFDATDVFLGAMAELPNVLLAGQPTGGGSGRPVTFELPESRTRVSLSSMWSLRPNGALYDFNGVHPDVATNRQLPEYLGEADLLLDAVVDHILNPRPWEE